MSLFAADQRSAWTVLCEFVSVLCEFFFVIPSFLRTMDPLADAASCSKDKEEPPTKKKRCEEEGKAKKKEEVPNPWPYLQPVLQFCGSTSPRGLQYKCVLCTKLGKSTYLKCDKSSSSNLKAHLRKVHLSDKSVWEPVLVPPSPSLLPPVQPVGDNPFSIAKKSAGQLKLKSGNQEECNEAIVAYMIESMHSWRTVDMASFKTMLNTFQPNRKVMSRSTLMRTIVKKYSEGKARLCQILGGVKFLATTTDCWSNFNR